MRELRRIASFVILGAACVLVAACSFEHGVLPEPDAPGANVPSVSFDQSTTTVDEMSGTVKIGLVLSEPSPVAVTVDYAVTTATALRPDDYVLTDGTVIFAPGQVLRNIDVVIEMDTLEEPDETITMTLSNPIGAALGTRFEHTVTISSDILARVSFADPTTSNALETTSPQIELVLSIPPKAPVSIEIGVAGTATPGGVDHALIDSQVVTFPANVTSKLVPVGVVQDLLDEDSETVDLTLKNPSAGLLLAATGTTRRHVIDDDDPMPTVSFALATSTTLESANATLTVNLSAASGRTVVVPYAVSGGTASAADATVVGAPGTLTFAAGETTKTISVTVVDDTLDEPDETLAVSLSTPTNATLGLISTHTLTITDNDDPPTVQFVTATASVVEAATAVNLVVTLSTASSFDVTVPFTVNVASTANNPADYTIATSPVTIPAGSTTANIVVTVKADTLDEADETVIVDLGTPTNATLGTIRTETLTITDNDDPPTVAFTSTGSSPFEANQTITLTVQLSAVSGLDVTVPYTIDLASTATDPDDYTISPISPITIPAGQTSTTISIVMKEDTTAEADETVIVVLGTPTNATLGTPTTYTLTIRNDDNNPNVSWNSTDGTELEGSTPPGPSTRTVTYRLVLSAASALTVTVPILYTGTATKGTDYDGPTSVSFSPGTVSVDVVLTITKDNVFEADETIIMTIDSGNVVNGGTSGTLARTHTLLNDDV